MVFSFSNFISAFVAIHSIAKLMTATLTRMENGSENEHVERTHCCTHTHTPMARLNVLTQFSR